MLKKFNKIIFILTISLLIFNFFQGTVISSLSPQTKNSEYAPDELIVKFKTFTPDTLDVDFQSFNTQKEEDLSSKLNSDSIKALMERYGVTETDIDRLFKTQFQEKEALGSKTIREALEKKFPGFEEKFGGTYSSLTDLSTVYKFKLKEGSNVLAAAHEFSQDPNVEYAEPNYICHISMIPNDPYYHSTGSWGQDYDDLWGLKKIQCEQAWDISQGEGVVVAVIDTGIDYNHEDIIENIWLNEDEFPDNGIDDDNNGYIDDTRGWDFCRYSNTPDNEPLDDNGHGTHVAGTICAIGNNGLGIIGVTPKAKIMALKGLGADGSGWTTDLADCIIYAVDNGAKILNNSWGGKGYSRLIADSVSYAHSKDVIVVAAAGNSSSDAGSFFPAGLEGVLTVTATDFNDRNARFSNYGRCIEVSAPGVDILSLRASGTDMYGDGRHIVGENYYYASGTSMAAPHAAGVCALIRGLHPDWTSQDVITVLCQGSDDLGTSGHDIYYGFGRVNAYKSVNIEQPGLLPPYNLRAILDRDASGNLTGFVHLEWDMLNPTNIFGYNIYRGQTKGGPYQKENFGLITTKSFIDESVIRDTSYYYVVTAVSNDGFESSYSNEVNIILTNHNPVIKANCYPTLGRYPLRVYFSSRGTYDPDGDKLTYLWEFGDGKSSSSPNTYHIYRRLGISKATLTVTDSKGGSSKASFKIFVFYIPVRYSR